MNIPISNSPLLPRLPPEGISTSNPRLSSEPESPVVRPGRSQIASNRNSFVSETGDTRSPRTPKSTELSFNFDSPHTPHFEYNMAASLPSHEMMSSDRGARVSESGPALGMIGRSISSSEKNIFFGDSQNNKVIQVFVDLPNKKLMCPKCKNVFKDPVITTCGHTFCKSCIPADSQETCPIDRKQTKYIVDNIALCEQIGELTIHCKYGCKETEDGGYEKDDSGCPAQVKLSERLQHEDDCEYAFVSCPNNDQCPLVRKMDLATHLETCYSVSCSNKKHGCRFVATDGNIDEHIKNCSYNKVKEQIDGAQVEEVLKHYKSTREDVDFLYASLQGLSKRCNELETAKEKMISSIYSHEQQLKTMQGTIDELRTELQTARESNIDLAETLKQRDMNPQPAQPYYNPGPYDLEPVVIKCKGTCVGHSGPVWCLGVDNDFLFSGSSDNHVKVWDTSANYHCVKTLAGHSGIVLSLAVYGGRLFSGSQDTKVLVWSVSSSFDLEDTLDAHDNPVCTLAASKGMLFSGSLKVVKVWDVTGSKCTVLLREITGFNHWVRALYATDKELYCGSYQTIEIYSLDSWNLTTTLKTFGGSVYSICVTDKNILCGTYEKVIHVWELSTMEQITTLQGHQGTVYALSWMNSPSGTMIFSASYDRTIRVWSMSNMICKQTLIRHTGSVACLAVSKGRLFSGGIDGMVKVWH